MRTMTCSGRSFFLAALLVALGIPLPHAAVAASELTCTFGRYLVRGKSPLTSPHTRSASTSEASPTSTDTIILLAGDRVSIADVCPPTKAVLSKVHGGTKVKATWAKCEGVRGRVHLAGVVKGEGCRSFNGRIAAGGRRGHRFRATFTLVGKGDCGGEGTFDQIQRRIFGPRGCRVETCHGVAKAGGLDLRQGAAYGSLVDVAATNDAAHAAGESRVAPGDPTHSFLWRKLAGELTAGEGARMPQVGRTLNESEVELVRAWILAGASPTDPVAGAPCLPPEQYHPGPDLATPPGGYQIVFEGPTLNPGEEIEGCMWVRSPNTEDFAVGRWEYSISPGTHHFALWPHERDPMPEENVFKRDVACFNGGAGVDGLSGAPEAPYYVEGYPAGVGRIVKANSLIGINPHYHNEFDVPVQIRAVINMYPVAGGLQHTAVSLTSTAGSLDGMSLYTISVPPFSIATLRARYGPTTGPWSIFKLSGHEHQRGVRFTAWKSDGTKLFDNFDWSHPNFVYYDPPLVLQPGDYIEYECEHDNGVNRPVRRCGDSTNDRGCTPGDPVTLRFGLTSVDEMCLLVGLYHSD